MKRTITLTRERECKHSWRYAETGESPVFGTVYISKMNFLSAAGFPMEVVIELKTKEE